MDRGFTDILSPDRSVALKASAGSGKTFSLSLRVVNLLLEGVEPDRILCLTFTNKATNEMYERIVRILSSLRGDALLTGVQEAEALQLAEYWMNKGTGEDAAGVLTRLRKRAGVIHEGIVREMSRLRVSTIDSFFNTILRLFPFDAGVLPDFRIITESEEDEIYVRAYDEFMKEVRSDGLMKELLTRLVLLSGSTELSPLKILDACFREMHSIRTELEGLDLPELYGKRGAGMILRDFHLLGEVEGKVKELAASLSATMRTRYPGLSGRAAAEVRRYSECSVNDLPGLTSLAKDRYPDYRYFASLEYLPEVQESFDRLKEAMREYFRLRNGVFQRLTLHLFRLFLGYVDRMKEELNVLSFDDVTRRCYRLLIGEGLLGESPDYFYFRLDSRIEHLLIDEFQDTSIVQWKILKPIADELTAGMGQKERTGSFFYVGDPKQSIYRFRGGESRLFDRVLAAYPGRLVARSLRRNFRSARVIVDFVNHVFTSVSRSHGYGYEEQEPTVDREGYVDVRFLPREAGADRERIRELKMETVLSFIEGLVGKGVLPGDIAVLCQKNRTCEEYAELLRNNGYDVLTESSERLMEQPPVRAVMNLLRWISDPGQPLYLAAFLFSVDGLLGEGGFRRLFHESHSWDDIPALFPEVAERLQRLQALAGLVPVCRLIERIVEEFGLQRAFGHDPNLLYLLGMAASDEIPAPQCVADFISFVESRSSTKAIIPSGTSDRSVRLMTVHKAKGLEFPHVILPELDIRMTFDSRNRPLMIDLDEEMSARGIFLSENSKVSMFVPELKELRLREEERIRTDLLNYLYVALTRAKEGLLVVAEAPAGGDPRSLSDVLYQAMEAMDGEAVPSYRRGSLPERDMPAVHGPAGRRRRRSFTELSLSLGEVLQGCRPDSVAVLAGDDTGGGDPGEFMDRLFGEAFHYALELLRDFSADSVPWAVDKVRQHYAALGGEAIRSIEKRLLRLVGDRPFLELLKGETGLHEAPLVSGESGYRVDFLVFDAGTIRVLDFKTGKTPALLRRYMEQVGNYMGVIREAFGPEITSVEGYLVFAGEDDVEVVGV